MADAAHVVLSRQDCECTGQILIDDEVLASAGITDLSPYAVTPGNTRFFPDLFLD
jgi:citronellol/citronellal dehydrogenase